MPHTRLASPRLPSRRRKPHHPSPSFRRATAREGILSSPCLQPRISSRCVNRLSVEDQGDSDMYLRPPSTLSASSTTISRSSRVSSRPFFSRTTSSTRACRRTRRRTLTRPSPTSYPRGGMGLSPVSGGASLAGRFILVRLAERSSELLSCNPRWSAVCLHPPQASSRPQVSFTRALESLQAAYNRRSSRRAR